MREHANGFQNLGGGVRAVLAAPTSRQSQLGMDAASPVNDQDDFTGLRIYVDDHLANQCPNDALLEPFIGPWIMPNRLQIGSQISELLACAQG